MFFLDVLIDISIREYNVQYVLRGERTLLLALVNCCLVFGYSVLASRILYLQGPLFLLFKKPKVWTVIHGDNGCLDVPSVDNSERKLTRALKRRFLCRGWYAPYVHPFPWKAVTSSTKAALPGSVGFLMRLCSPLASLLSMGTEPEWLLLFMQ